MRQCCHLRKQIHLTQQTSPLQKRWQETTNMAEKRDIEKAIGLRGKRASELLQGNINDLMKEYEL